LITTGSLRSVSLRIIPCSVRITKHLPNLSNSYRFPIILIKMEINLLNREKPWTCQTKPKSRNFAGRDNRRLAKLTGIQSQSQEEVAKVAPVVEWQVANLAKIRTKMVAGSKVGARTLRKILAIKEAKEEAKLAAMVVALSNKQRR
jgi:hypothetical protein